VWAFRTGRDTATEVSASTTREEEKKKAMARRRLTFEEQLKGVRAAIRSNKTPPQLRAGLRKLADWLAAEIRRGQRSKRGKKKRSPWGDE